MLRLYYNDRCRLHVRLGDRGWLVLLHYDYLLTVVLNPEAGIFFVKVVHRFFAGNVQAEVVVTDVVVRVVHTLEAVETRVEDAFMDAESGISVEQLVVLVGMDPHDPVLVTEELLLDTLGLHVFKRYGAGFASETGVVDLELVSLSLDNECFFAGVLAPVMAGEVLRLEMDCLAILDLEHHYLWLLLLLDDLYWLLL